MMTAETLIKILLTVDPKSTVLLEVMSDYEDRLRIAKAEIMYNNQLENLTAESVRIYEDEDKLFCYIKLVPNLLKVSPEGEKEFDVTYKKVE